MKTTSMNSPVIISAGKQHQLQSMTIPKININFKRENGYKVSKTKIIQREK